MLGLQTDAVQWRAVDGEIMVLDVRSNRYLAINASGVRLWTLLARGTTREELVAALQSAYALPQEAAEQDVAAFLADLRSRSVLQE